ncbi:MAG: hypothetical protein ACRDTX_30085 [Pseudonocardiaceae bacterium]
MKLRMPDDTLETGDLAVHDEETYPVDTLIATATATATAIAIATDGARQPVKPAPGNQRSPPSCHQHTRTTQPEKG